jgi:hypothetical protein
MVEKEDMELETCNIFKGITKLADIIFEMVESGEDLKEFNGVIENPKDPRNVKAQYSFRLNVGGIDKLEAFNAMRIKENQELKYLESQTEVSEEEKEI